MIIKKYLLDLITIGDFHKSIFCGLVVFEIKSQCAEERMQVVVLENAFFFLKLKIFV